MSSGFSVGDTVLVAFPKECGCYRKLGEVFTIQRFENRGVLPCCNCRKLISDHRAIGEGMEKGYTLPRLVKLPDVEDTEGLTNMVPVSHPKKEPENA